MSTTKRVKIGETVTGGCSECSYETFFSWDCPLCHKMVLCYGDPPDDDTRECSECGATFQRDPSWEIVSKGKGKS